MDERKSAYGDVVAALLAAGDSPATRRFDAALDAALAAGLLDDDTARALRWWQRASVREVADHARIVLPGVFIDLVESAASAADAVIVADDAWQQAGGRTLGRGRHARSVEVAGGADTNATADPPVGAAEDAVARQAGPAADAAPTTTTPSEHWAQPAAEDEAAGPAPADADAASAPAEPAAPAPAAATAGAAAGTAAASSTDPSVRRRLVVAGLTRTG